MMIMMVLMILLIVVPVPVIPVIFIIIIIIQRWSLFTYDEPQHLARWVLVHLKLGRVLTCKECHCFSFEFFSSGHYADHKVPSASKTLELMGPQCPKGLEICHHRNGWQGDEKGGWFWPFKLVHRVLVKKRLC